MDLLTAKMIFSVKRTYYFIPEKQNARLGVVPGEGGARRKF